VNVYSKILRSKIVSPLLTGLGAIDALPAITLLRKLCNHPHLVAAQMEEASDINAPLTPEERHQLSSSLVQHSGGHCDLALQEVSGLWE